MSNSETQTSALTSILHGASFHTLGKLIYNLASGLLNLLLTRAFGVDLYGIYAYGKTLVSVVGIFSDLGAESALVRYLPVYRDSPSNQNTTFSLGCITGLLSSTVLAASLFFAAPLITRFTIQDPLFTASLRVFAFVLPFRTVIRIFGSAFRGQELIKYNVLTEEISLSVARVVAVGSALLLGYSVIGSIMALVCASMGVLLLSAALLAYRTTLRPTMHMDQEEIIEFYNYSVPLTFSNAGALLYNRADILMVGFFLSSSAVAVYNVSILIAGFLSFPLVAFNRLFMPIASRLYADNDFEELNEIFSIVTRWAVTITLFLAIALFIYRTELLRIFGNGFTSGGDVLLLFIIGQFINTAVGPSNNLLMVSGHQYLTMINHSALGVLNVVLNVIFIQEFGIIGAAAATATILGIVNILRLVQLRFLEGLFPYTSTFVKPIFAGVLAASLMYCMQFYLSGYLLLVGGSAIGGVVYVGALVVCGIEDGDRELINELRNQRSNS